MRGVRSFCNEFFLSPKILFVFGAKKNRGTLRFSFTHFERRRGGRHERREVNVTLLLPVRYSDYIWNMLNTVFSSSLTDGNSH